MKWIATLVVFVGLQQAHAVNIYPSNPIQDLNTELEGDFEDFTDGELRQAFGLQEKEEIYAEDLLHFARQSKARGKSARGSFPGDRAPIWKSFIGNFKKCAPGCIPTRYGTYGKRRGKSCHPSGQAVDVGGIVCGGKTHWALQGGRFAQFVQCMKPKMKTLYRDGKHRTLGHHDHAHFSNGCRVRGKTTY